MDNYKSLLSAVDCSLINNIQLFFITLFERFGKEKIEGEYELCFIALKGKQPIEYLENEGVIQTEAEQEEDIMYLNEEHDQVFGFAVL